MLQGCPVVLVPGNEWQAQVTALQRLAHLFRDKEWVTSATVIDTAIIPVLKLETAAGIPVDLTVDVGGGRVHRGTMTRYAAGDAALETKLFSMI